MIYNDEFFAMSLFEMIASIIGFIIKCYAFVQYAYIYIWCMYMDYTCMHSILGHQPPNHCANMSIKSAMNTGRQIAFLMNHCRFLLHWLAIDSIRFAVLGNLTLASLGNEWALNMNCIGWEFIRRRMKHDWMWLCRIAWRTSISTCTLLGISSKTTDSVRKLNREAETKKKQVSWWQYGICYLNTNSTTYCIIILFHGPGWFQTKRKQYVL